MARNFSASTNTTQNIIAPITRHDIAGLGRRSPQRHRKLAQKRIAAGMPVVVIPAFKAVDKFQVRTTQSREAGIF